MTVIPQPLSGEIRLARLESVVAVHRLRAVTCLYGFTRLEPAATFTEQMLEDVRLAVDGAQLSEAADWLPAMEQLKEGIFLKIRPEAVREWLKRQAVQRRGEALRAGTQNYADKHKGVLQFPGLPCILLHSLSHALMEEIALDCGYPLSSPERAGLRNHWKWCRSNRPVRHPHLRREFGRTGNSGRTNSGG